MAKMSKDQVGHWYEAQLIHYGLQRSKDKNAAKVRLQQAINQGKLKTQPPHLADMEAQMKVVMMIRHTSPKLSTDDMIEGVRSSRSESQEGRCRVEQEHERAKERH